MKLKQTELSYKQQLLRIGQGLYLSTLMFFVMPVVSVKAQIIPDGSLPTSVEQQGENELNINGGEREGNNLFHSFEEFSIPEGLEAVFENAADIENIFTRITGDTASSINGILRTQGGANFFLVNPNGIVFSENAQLDVGGSFIGTTANSIQFEDGVEFTTNDVEEQPILTVSVPIGLQLDENSGAIVVDGNGNQITNSSTFSPIEFSEEPNGLSVSNDKTFALVGNGINFNGGVINIQEGQVFLISVNSGLLEINKTENSLNILDSDVAEYQNINLNQQSLINANGEGASKIFIRGKDINILDASFVISQNQGTLSDGLLDIQAFASLTLSGAIPNTEIASSIRSDLLAIGEGKGSDINISAQELRIQDQAVIQAGTFSDDPVSLGGDININVSNITQLNDGLISASAFSEGSAGNIKLSTSQLQVQNRASLTSSTTGSGKGGNITINTNTINLNGSFPTVRSTISASSLGSGDSGTLTINTEQLQIKEGASLSSASFGNGNAGNISINASESIELDGTNSNFQSDGKLQSTTIRTSVQSIDPIAQRIFGLPKVPDGNSGNLNISTPVLNLSAGSSISAENQGTGIGGSLYLNADQISLEEAGNITVASVSGTGGNIQLNAENLQIDENSNITATAGNNGNGGNVTIKTTSLIAKKNSQVTANAFNGRGGNLEINAEGLFLFDSPENIFSASSELGIDGTIQINTPDINFQRELEQSELEFVVLDQAISNSCLARSSGQASFNISGNDEFPKNPNFSNYSDANFSLTGVNSLSVNKPALSTQADNSQHNQSTIPAQKMVETEDGRILLVAAPQQAKSIYCHSTEEQ